MAKGLSPGANKRILIFDLKRETLETVKNAFIEYGYIVDAVSPGGGFEIVKNEPPEIIIADMDFPGLSGLELLQKVKAEKLNIPVILVGENSDSMLDAFRSGAADYFMKPLDSIKLQSRVPAIISLRLSLPPGADIDAYNRLIREIEREKKEISDLLKISSSLNLSSNLKESLNNLTELAAESMNCEAASIMLANRREKVLEFVVATGEKRLRLETISVPMSEGIAGWVATHGEPQIVNDTSNDPRFTGKVDKESGFVTRQIVAVPMKVEGEITGVLEVINTCDHRILGAEDLRLLGGITERAVAVIEMTKKIENQQNFYVQTTNLIVLAIEKKDIYSVGHAWKVAELCHKISRAMNVSESDRNELHFGALLHDIGKLDMPSVYFNKRELSDREKEILRQHPVKGAKLLEPITLWKPIIPCVLYHHEAWDGSGYIFGRSGESIPLNARIVNLSEAFTVMRSGNSYKRQMTLKESVFEVIRNSGKQFDPGIVKVFVGVLEKETPAF
ncbi:MAG: HD domain-containing phosphohydrolase [Candidatus Latescibacter sp.]|nr:HD domain-containing phosphohydrolase [Candidatus Latescibacter sp.]